GHPCTMRNYAHHVTDKMSHRDASICNLYFSSRYVKFTLHFKKGKSMETFEFILGALAITTGITIPVSVFFWLYKDAKNKRETVIEISKNIENPDQLEKLINIFDERKKDPIDYRRSGVVTFFVGIGLFLFGTIFIGPILKGVGALIMAIGLGQIIAGYLYPNTSEEITNAVEDFEKN
ncbi:MAG: DUF6249 domain-containing protein, partial [Pseudomonadota bacterium]|nr:DUF6249 domain-containing protein [Pseudomonadota bacterium]